MAELQNLLQTSNGAFKSDLMKVFVSHHKGDYSKTGASPTFNQNVTGGTTGAALFSQTAPTTETTTTTTTTTMTNTTGVDTTDNANMLIQNVTDNQGNQTSNISPNTTTSTNSTTTSANTNTTDNNTTITNANMNANVNANNMNKPVQQQLQKSSNPAAQLQQQQQQQQPATPEAPDTNANVCEVNAVLEEVKGAMSEQRRMLVGQVRDATVDCHLATCINTHQAVQEATARFMAMKEAGALPDMSKLSLSAGSMWEQMMAQMMPEMAKCIKFCKMLPGFTDLALDDQMKLIKQGSFEVMMTRFAMLIDHEKETMLDPSHKMCCPRKVIQEMPMGKFLDGFFYIGSQFNPVGLTDGEIGLFTATLIFSPSRAGLTDSKVVAKIQALYQQALFTLMKQNHSDPETKFAKLLSLVPMFRRINEEHSKALGAMQMQSPEGFGKQFPPLHREMYTKPEQ